jgi:hypothetical protein
MGWVIYYAILFVMFSASTAYAFGHPQDSLSSALRDFAGALTMLTALGQSLAKANFRVYLLTQQVWLRFHKDTTALWRFGLRLDGLISNDPMREAHKILESELDTWKPKLLSSNEREIRVILDRTIHLVFTYEPAIFSGDGEDHILVRSDEVEIPYGSAKRKLDSCIVPLLGILSRSLKSSSSSTMLEVYFSRRNPFFAFFVAHLKPEQVSQFNLVFRPSSLSRNENDKVVVTQNRITINAESTDSFATLAKAFLLLSEDAATVERL